MVRSVISPGLVHGTASLNMATYSNGPLKRPTERFSPRSIALIVCNPKRMLCLSLDLLTPALPPTLCYCRASMGLGYMLSKTFRFITVLSSLAFVLVTLLWVFTYAHSDDLSFHDRRYDIVTVPGQLWLQWSDIDVDNTGTIWHSSLDAKEVALRIDEALRLESWNLAGFGYRCETLGDPTKSWHRLRIPLWMPALLCFPLSFVWFIGWRLRWEKEGRLAEGRCVVCGYDLCKTPERSPECPEHDVLLSRHRLSGNNISSGEFSRLKILVAILVGLLIITTSTLAVLHIRNSQNAVEEKERIDKIMEVQQMANKTKADGEAEHARELAEQARALDIYQKKSNSN